MQLVIDIPDQYFLNEPMADMAQRLKLSAALLMFQAGQMSAGAACEFAGIDRYAFIDACHTHRIPVIDYDAGELEAEFAQLRGEHGDRR